VLDILDATETILKSAQCKLCWQKLKNDFAKKLEIPQNSRDVIGSQIDDETNAGRTIRHRKNYVTCWDKEWESLYRSFLRDPFRPYFHGSTRKGRSDGKLSILSKSHTLAARLGVPSTNLLSARSGHSSQIKEINNYALTKHMYKIYHNIFPHIINDFNITTNI